MLRWQDWFRPLIEASDGLDAGPLTRFIDTNSFLRPPRANQAEPRLREPVDERYVAPLPGPRLVTLPSPSFFADLVGIPASALVESLLKPQIEALDAELIVLWEPFLARSDRPTLEPLADALEKLAGTKQLAVHFAYGDAGRVLEAGAAELPVDGIGVDFYATHVTDIPEGFDKLLLAGVVDARSTALEEPREIAAFVEQVRERGIERIALVPNGDLQYVPEAIAREKVARLGAAKTATVEAIV